MEWMLGCVVIDDHNENIRIAKENLTNGKRIDGIIAAIMALGGSPKKNNPSIKK
jgi:phage terminase large subunit-like protein